MILKGYGQFLLVSNVKDQMYNVGKRLEPSIYLTFFFFFKSFNIYVIIIIFFQSQEVH